MKPIKLKINTKTQQYPIIIGSNLSSKIAKIIKDNSISFKQCLLDVDANVPKKIVSKIKKSLNKKKSLFTFLEQMKLIKILTVLIIFWIFCSIKTFQEKIA